MYGKLRNKEQIVKIKLEKERNWNKTVPTFAEDKVWFTWWKSMLHYWQEERKRVFPVLLVTPETPAEAVTVMAPCGSPVAQM